MERREALKIRTRSFVNVHGKEYPPGTVLDLPDREALGMVGEQVADELQDQGQSEVQPGQTQPPGVVEPDVPGEFSPGGGAKHSAPPHQDEEKRKSKRGSDQ
jgi:hypothetical protein